VTKRRRPTQIHADERQDILAMSRAGYSVAGIADTLDRSQITIRKVLQAELASFRDAVVAVTQAEPTTRGEQYLQWHAAATAAAAAMGNAQPAMDMLDRLGMVPETSRDRTLLQVSREKSEAQKLIASTYATSPAHALGRPAPTVNIGIGFPAQLAVSHVQGDAVTQVSGPSNFQRLTATQDEGLEIPSSQVVVHARPDAG
jgi:hypothetical protein